MASTHRAPTEALARSSVRTRTPLADPVFETVVSAAEKLGIDATRLRKRCLRRGQRVGDCVVALLDNDVVAFKFGPRWRIRFMQP
jgi:hypothetical protein